MFQLNDSLKPGGNVRRRVMGTKKLKYWVINNSFITIHVIKMKHMIYVPSAAAVVFFMSAGSEIETNSK